ncbi:hypothetical protein AVEN_183302-1 [Araneus ventricosus]|uniref:Uncharacterized protein n=1 Tax=Araneus ventricosus TaxID=182803 RepID=A0A4Y2EVF5_ARAVE|nr:hypothetical protein AVEN_183302-1 [Araneus ventricosus]
MVASAVEGYERRGCPKFRSCELWPIRRAVSRPLFAGPMTLMEYKCGKEGRKGSCILGGGIRSEKTWRRTGEGGELVVRIIDEETFTDCERSFR